MDHSNASNMSVPGRSRQGVFCLNTIPVTVLAAVIELTGLITSVGMFNHVAY